MNAYFLSLGMILNTHVTAAAIYGAHFDVYAVLAAMVGLPDEENP